MGFLQSIGKAFSSVVAKRYVGIVDGGLPSTRRSWGASDFLNANETSLITNRAITKRAEKVSEIEFVLKDRNGNIIEKPDDLINLLYRPNKIFTGRQFWSLAQKYYDLTGETYIYIERRRELFENSKVVGLHILRSDLVEPKFTSEGEIESFEYRTPAKTIKYEAKDILYAFNPDPKTPLRGQSLLRAGIGAIQTESQISTYHTRLLENGGRVEGVFKFKTQPLSKDQLKDIKDQYQKEYAGAKRSGLPLFLGGDADYINTGLTPTELAYLEAKKMTFEDICVLTGVPRSVLMSLDDIQYSNAETGYRIFLRETIRPLLQMWASLLDERLFPDDRILDFVDPTPENVDERLKVIESGQKNYYRTVNETRILAGEEPIDGGDVLLVPFNLMPLGKEEVASAKGFRNKSESNHPLQDPDARRVYEKVAIKRADRREKRFKRVLDEYLEGQRDRLIAGLDPNKTRVFRKENLIDELLQVGVEVKIGKDMLVPVMTDLLKDAGIDAMELVGSSGTFNMGAEIVSWIDGRADIFLNQITETTLKELKNAFSESLASGESRDALVNRIQGVYGDIKKERAITIARTEVHNSTQYGTIQGYKQAGMTTKIWVAVMDASTRDSHASVDGEERPIDVPFTNGLMFPGDPRGSAEEVINCRCVV